MKPTTYQSLEETTITQETLYTGAILTLQKDKVRLINGKEATREVVRHPGGVAVLALSDDHMVTLVDQYRYPMGKVIRELPAGKLDGKAKGEEGHLEGAKRELKEETGLTADKYTYLGSILVSPGFCDEELHMYLAQDLHQAQANPDEDEFLNVVQLPFQDLVEQVMHGELADGKTVAAILKTKLHLGL